MNTILTVFLLLIFLIIFIPLLLCFSGVCCIFSTQNEIISSFDNCFQICDNFYVGSIIDNIPSINFGSIIGYLS